MMIGWSGQKGFLGLVIFFIVLAVLVVSGIVIAVNLPNSLPGELIYPLKGIYENIRLATNELSHENRAEVFIELSNNRLDEFKKLVDKKEYEKISETLDNMVMMQKRALDSMERAQGHSTNIASVLLKLESSLQKQQSSLKELYYQLPPQIYDTIDKAIGAIQENLDRADIIRGRR